MQITTDRNMYLRQLATQQYDLKHIENLSKIEFPKLETPTKFDVYTVEEAAKLLHHTVSKSAIYRHISTGDIKAKMVGKQYLISGKAIKDFIECREEKNPQDFIIEKTKASGLSSTKENKSGLDALEKSMKKLKKNY